MRTLEFVFKVLDPFLIENWGIYSIDFNEECGDHYDHIFESLVCRDLRPRLSPSAAEYWQSPTFRPGKDAPLGYAKWFAEEMRRAGKPIDGAEGNQWNSCRLTRHHQRNVVNARTNRWVVASAIVALILGAIVSRVIATGVGVEKRMITLDEQLENRLRFLREANTEGMPHSDRALLNHCLAPGRLVEWGALPPCVTPVCFIRFTALNITSRRWHSPGGRGAAVDRGGGGSLVWLFCMMRHDLFLDLGKTEALPCNTARPASRFP